MCETVETNFSIKRHFGHWGCRCSPSGRTPSCSFHNVSFFGPLCNTRPGQPGALPGDSGCFRPLHFTVLTCTDRQTDMIKPFGRFPPGSDHSASLFSHRGSNSTSEGWMDGWMEAGLRSTLVSGEPLDHHTNWMWVSSHGEHRGVFLEMMEARLSNETSWFFIWSMTLVEEVLEYFK